MIRPLRVWRHTYYCDECPNEFTDDMLTVSESWCPCCEKECWPEHSEPLFVDVEVDDEEDADEGIGPSLYTADEMGRLKDLTEEPDPDLLRAMQAERLAILKEIA